MWSHSILNPKPTSAPLRLFWYLLSVIALAVVAELLARALVPPAPSPWHRLIILKILLLPVAMYLVYMRLVRRLEHRPALEVDIRTSPWGVLIGAAVGFAVIAAFVAVLWMLRIAHVSPGTGLTGLPTEVLTALMTAAGEELLFRVILFRLIEEIGGTAVAIAVSAAIFGLSLAANPGTTALTITGHAVDSGVLLAIAFILTRNIWLAVGIHAGWNFAESYFFGLLNAGVPDSHCLFRVSLSGADFLTGGNSGPDGSLVLIGVSVAVSALLCGMSLSGGRWKPVRFRLS